MVDLLKARLFPARRHAAIFDLATLSAATVVQIRRTAASGRASTPACGGAVAIARRIRACQQRHESREDGDQYGQFLYGHDALRCLRASWRGGGPGSLIQINNEQ